MPPPPPPQNRRNNNNNNSSIPAAAASSSSSLKPVPNANSRLLTPDEVLREVDKLHSALLSKLTQSQEKSTRAFRRLYQERELAFRQLNLLESSNRDMWLLWSQLLEQRVKVVQKEDRQWARLEELARSELKRLVGVERGQHNGEEEGTSRSSNSARRKSPSPATSSSAETQTQQPVSSLSSSSVAVQTDPVEINNGDKNVDDDEAKQFERVDDDLRRREEAQRRRELESSHQQRERELLAESSLLRIQLTEIDRRRLVENTSQHQRFDLQLHFAEGYSRIWEGFAAKMSSEMMKLDLLLLQQ